MGSEKCHSYFQKLVDNLRTKIRNKVESLNNILDYSEYNTLEEIFTNGQELDIRQLQLEKMRDSADWKQDVSCAPQTIIEKLMFF